MVHAACMLASLALVANANELLSDAEVHTAWDAWKRRFNKMYKSDGEAKQGQQNFKASMQRILDHNSLDSSWTKGLNQFSDLTNEDFMQNKLMVRQVCSATHNALGSRPQMSAATMAALPTNFDWREVPGVISEVKNQGHCGSCWTFSSTGCLEAHVALKYGSWHRSLLSEQQLLECAQKFNNQGCAGGLPSHAFQYIQHAGGLDTELNYPYTATDDETCKFNASERSPPTPFLPRSAGIGAQVPGGSVNLTVGDEDALKYHLATTGPVSIAYQVADDFRDYQGGVYTSTRCKNGAMDVNHAVVAVGYGTDPDSGLDYWLVKNSWDYTFGLEGYFKIEAYKNMCGVADCMSYPDLYGDGKIHVVAAATKQGKSCSGLACHSELMAILGVLAIAFGTVLAAGSALVFRRRTKRMAAHDSASMSLQQA